MKLISNLSAGTLTVEGNGAVFGVSCDVRSLRDGTRPSYEVVRTCPGNLPYDPRPFPKGLWLITGIEWQRDKGFDSATYGPVKIKTNAYQMVKVWKLDEYGDYLKETDRVVQDECYWLHYSNSRTTLGCIRWAGPDIAVAVAGLIQAAFDRNEQVQLEVV